MGALTVASLRTHEAFVVESTDPLSGVPVVAAVAPVSDVGWRAIVLRPLSIARSQARAEPVQLLTAAAPMAVLLMGAAALWVVYRRSRRAAPGPGAT